MDTNSQNSSISSADTPAGRFDQLLQKLQPKDTNSATITKIKWLKELLEDDVDVDEIFLSGSYKRSTAIHPLKDVDIFAVLKNNTHIKEQLVTKMLEILGRRIPVKTNDNKIYSVTLDNQQHLVVRRQNCSIGIAWGTSWGNESVTFDIIPAIDNHDGTYTIEKRRVGPVETNPKEAMRLVAQYDVQWNGQFSNLVKFAKKWNIKNQKPTEEEGNFEKPFKSFHLEVLCYKFAEQHVRAKPASLHLDMPQLFEYLSKHCTDLVPVPGVPQKANLQLHSGGMWTANEVREKLEIARDTATKAVQAEKNRNKEEAIDCWNALFD